MYASMKLGARGFTTAVVLLAAVAVAGCVSNDAAPEERDGVVNRRAAERVDLTDYSATRPIFALKEIKPFVTTAGDGIKLRGHVYLPDREWPVSTILEYSPYFNGQNDPSDGRVQTVDGRRTMTGNHRVLLEAGFAVALVNLRGTGISQGCVQWGTPIDVEDAANVIETLAAMPWSNGKVGMVGTSYPGWTQYMALASKAPSLKAVIPVSGVIDLYSLLGRYGATLSIGPVVTTQWHTLYSVALATYSPADARGGEANHLECGPRISEDASASLQQYAVGDRTPYWTARDLRPLIAESQVPILFTNGFTDGEGHILQFEGLWESVPHENKRAMLGQWGHGGTNHPSGDWPLMRVAWFDHWLNDGPPLLETNLVEYQDDLGNWHETDNWPPARVDTTVYLSDGALVEAKDAVAASSQTFQSSHANPCPGLCTNSFAANTEPQEPCGPFQALYVSPPIAEDVLLAGNFHANLTITSTEPDGNLAVFLYRTKGDGACPDTSIVEVRRALTDLRHARFPDHPGADFPIGTATAVNLISHPFASPLEAGERLVLAVGGGAMELTPDARLPVLTVTTGGNAQGMLTLPVVEGTLAFGWSDP